MDFINQKKDIICYYYQKIKPRPKTIGSRLLGLSISRLDNFFCVSIYNEISPLLTKDWNFSHLYIRS
jgi:hypothetical protein